MQKTITAIIAVCTKSMELFGVTFKKNVEFFLLIVYLFIRSDAY